jgi:hypothetical protein
MIEKGQRKKKLLFAFCHTARSRLFADWADVDFHPISPLRFTLESRVGRLID